MSFPCGLEHLRRCTGSTRWWSVDWHRCQPRYPRFVHFSWSFLVNWYIQSILYTPQSSQSHSYLLRFPTSMRNCRLVSVSPPSLSIPTGGIKILTPSTCLLLFTFPISVWCYWSTTLSSDATHLVHAMTCILPPSFLSKPFISFPAFGRIAFDLSPIPYVHDETCISSRCLLAAAALFYPSSKRFTSIGLDSFPVVLNTFLWTTSSRDPVVANFFFVFTYSFLLSFLFFFLLFICYLPLQPSFITIHELVTKTKQQCDDFFFAYVQRFEYSELVVRWGI